MRVVIAPEPAAWLPLLLRESTSIDAPVTILAPWSPPGGAALSWLLGRGPARLREALLRRRVDAGAARVQRAPGWVVIEGAARLWARGRTARRLAARFALRAAVDAWAAAWLRGRRDVRQVVAPSGCALRAFAVARAQGAQAVLVQDVPLLRQLHEDLDRAAARHPQAAFLRNYRAGREALVRQEAEWALASGEILVRGRFAAERLAPAGAPVRVLAPDGAADGTGDGAPVPAAVADGARAGDGAPVRVLLAGLAAARNGSLEALAAQARAAHVTLLVRPGEGAEPVDLLSRPRVQVATPAEREELRGVDQVLALALVESYPPEVGRALRRGIPVVATRRAAGPYEARPGLTVIDHRGAARCAIDPEEDLARAAGWLR